MTLSAGYLLVGTLQRIPGPLVVVKVWSRPFLACVTVYAGIHRFGVSKLRAVSVFVAREAVAIFIGKASVRAIHIPQSRLVADHTGLCEMGAVQWKFRVLVRGDGKESRFESLDMVAAFACTFIVAICKLTAMLVCVTVGAHRVLYGGQYVARYVALVAGQVHVLAPQGKVCAVVVYLALCDLVPPARVVATATVLSEMILVFVLVTICTLVVFEADELGKQGVGSCVITKRRVT